MFKSELQVDPQPESKEDEQISRPLVLSIVELTPPGSSRGLIRSRFRKVTILVSLRRGERCLPSLQAAPGDV